MIYLAQKISSILNWFSIRLDYYVETKQWELMQRQRELIFEEEELWIRSGIHMLTYMM